MSHDSDTENRIFEAAKDVFFEQGFDGARMATIARRAGINQSMLHYYFRSKELLFDAVFEKAAGQALPPVIDVLRTDGPLLEKLERFVRDYLAMIAANPHLPAFILQELRRNPDALRRFAGEATGGLMERLQVEFEDAAYRGLIRRVEVAHFMTNLLALCVFPFIGRPMLQTVMDMSDEAFDHFVAERGSKVVAFIRNALRP